jgi:hypothetical protein
MPVINPGRTFSKTRASTSFICENMTWQKWGKTTNYIKSTTGVAMCLAVQLGVISLDLITLLKVSSPHIVAVSWGD